jgi:excisionase family DNA binding protein
MSPGSSYITVKDAAEFLGVSPNTIRNWARDQKLPEYRHPINNYRLFKKSDLAKMKRLIESPNLKSRRTKTAID